MAKTNLDPLPNSDDEFWGDGEKHVYTPVKFHSEEGHYFVRRSGREAQCTHCDWGFALDPGDKIVDGHLVDRNGKLVL